MTIDPAALLAEIASGPLASELAVFAENTPDNAFAIAAALNREDRADKVTTRLDVAAVLSRLGAVHGPAFLDGLEAIAPNVSAVKWALVALKTGGAINVGDPQSQAMLTQLAGAGVPYAADVAALANGLVSRAQQAFGVAVTWNEVLAARSAA